MATKSFELNRDWRLDIDPENPAASFRVYRPDGKFFTVRFNTAKWGQPVLEEVRGQDDFGGKVIPVVADRGDGQWSVVVTRVHRPADNYTDLQIESARQSASNADPYLSVAGLPIRYFEQVGYANSARMSDRLRLGVVDVTSLEFTLPQGAEWISFKDFFVQSTDMMTKAVLGQFMVEVLQLA